ncbi:MAG: hypothetical protein WD278_13875 [Pirellulales bacterium]
MTEDKAESLQIPIDHRVPESPAPYANHMVVQRGQHEVLISFFQIQPPILLEKTIEEKRQVLEGLGSIPAICVARVAVSDEMMPAIITALQSKVKRNESKGEDNGA